MQGPSAGADDTRERGHFGWLGTESASLVPGCLALASVAGFITRPEHRLNGVVGTMLSSKSVYARVILVAVETRRHYLEHPTT